LVIENFTSGSSVNAVGGSHGSDLVTVSYSGGVGTFTPSTSAGQFYTVPFAGECADLTKYASSFLHLSLRSIAADQDFTISLQQHNSACNTAARFPVTWQDVQASWYRSGNEIYIPLSHLPIALKTVSALVLKAFRTTSAVQISRVEIVNSYPVGVVIPAKRPQAPLIFNCVVPNTVAFGIDDGVVSLVSHYSPSIQLV
jgi:hypothetical protein